MIDIKQWLKLDNKTIKDRPVFGGGISKDADREQSKARRHVDRSNRCYDENGMLGTDGVEELNAAVDTLSDAVSDIVGKGEQLERAFEELEEECEYYRDVIESLTTLIPYHHLEVDAERISEMCRWCNQNIAYDDYEIISLGLASHNRTMFVIKKESDQIHFKMRWK